MRRSVFGNLSNKREDLVRNLIIWIFNLSNHTHVITVGDFNKLIVNMSGFLQTVDENFIISKNPIPIGTHTEDGGSVSTYMK